MDARLAVGIAASSLALLSDAAHMLTDAAAITLSLVAIRLAKRPAKGALTFGLKRVEILSAQANGLTLLILALIIALLQTIVLAMELGSRHDHDRDDTTYRTR